MFQNYALFPQMTVGENVAYGLEARGVPRPTVGERVRAMLELVRMEGCAGRFPRELSGGQQQSRSCRSISGRSLDVRAAAASGALIVLTLVLMLVA